MRPHKITTVAFAFGLSLCASATLAADPIEGIWITEPDRKDLTSHIKVTSCDGKFCGEIQSAYDKNGKEVQTKNIGKQLFWGVDDVGGGKYTDGTFWVPLLDVKVTPHFTLTGNTMKVKGCETKLLCGNQTWTRK